MIELVIASLILLVGIGFYFLYYKPKRTIEKFALMARKAGYKVRLEPYTLTDFFVFKYVKQDNRSLQIYKNQLNEYDLVVGNLLTNMAILPNNPDILKDLFSQSSELHKHHFFAVIFRLLSSGGIAFAEGNEWKRKRKIISSIFHFDFLNDMIPIIQSEIQTQFKAIDKKIKNGEGTINLLKTFSKILSSVIIYCFFGTDVNGYEVEGKPFYQFYLEFLNQITQYSQCTSHLVLGVNSYNYGLTKEARNLKKNLNILITIVRQVIEKQLTKLKNNEFTHKNLLTTLYQNDMINQSEVNDPNKYTKDELMGEFFSFFGAGTDTTANTSNLILHYLTQKPQYIDKIMEEIRDVKSLQGSERLKNMKWIEAIFNQTLRVGTPAAGLLPRVIAENITVGGLEIPGGTSLSIYPIGNQFKSEYFEKPFEYIPQRWMNNQTIPNYVYIPFSAGQRNCIGQYLAKIQIKILISKIVEKYKFKAKYPIRMAYQFAYATEHGEFQMEIKNNSN